MCFVIRSTLLRKFKPCNDLPTLLLSAKYSNLRKTGARVVGDRHRTGGALRCSLLAKKVRNVNDEGWKSAAK
jgi:hypothetical protein